MIAANPSVLNATWVYMTVPKVLQVGGKMKVPWKTAFNTSEHLGGGVCALANRQNELKYFGTQA